MTRLVRSLAAALIPALLLVACSAAPSTTASAGPSASTPATMSPLPAQPTAVPGGNGGSPGDGTGSTGALPGQSLAPVPPPGGGGSIPAPSPTIVTPVGGLLQVRDVRASDLTATASGRNVTTTVAWWSGAAPCHALAGVDVARNGSTITLTVREGAQQLGVACPDIALYKATVVDLGTLGPGTYTITAVGDAAPVTVTVAG